MITKKTKSFNWDQIWHFSTEEPKLPYEKNTIFENWHTFSAGQSKSDKRKNNSITN